MSNGNHFGYLESIPTPTFAVEPNTIKAVGNNKRKGDSNVKTFSAKEKKPAKQQRQATLSSLLHINIKSKAGNSMRLMPPNKIDSMLSEATCIGCNRSFNTAQGLGGHQVL